MPSWRRVEPLPSRTPWSARIERTVTLGRSATISSGPVPTFTAADANTSRWSSPAFLTATFQGVLATRSGSRARGCASGPPAARGALTRSSRAPNRSLERECRLLEKRLQGAQEVRAGGTVDRAVVARERQRHRRTRFEHAVLDHRALVDGADGEDRDLRRVQHRDEL